MGKMENFRDNEAIKKIQELIEHTHVCMFTTQLSSMPLTTRPMSTLNVDDDGVLWFFSRDDSDKNEEIKQDGNVQLFYSNTGSSEYLSLFGRAEIIDDRDKINELWTPWAKTWFNEGKDDPSITLIKFSPEEGYYWDTQSNKMIQLIKIAFGALTGQETDDSLEGKVVLEHEEAY